MLSYFSRSVSLLTLSLLLSPLSAFQANARWATEDDASIECLEEKNVYHVKKDGSYTRESEVRLKILNEEARQALSTRIYTYNALNYTFEVLEAKTITNGEEFIVPKDKIEDKPLASEAKVLCRNHQVLVPFERLTVNSIIHLKIKEYFKNPLFENYFAESTCFGHGDFLKNYELLIESEVPLLYKVNDPRDNLTVKESKTESKHTLQFKLKKPLFEFSVNEADHSCRENENHTYLSISTEKDYERIGKIEANFYQPRLKEPLPEKLASIRDKASTITDEGKCIDTVVTHLMDHLHYLSISNTPTGALVPRSLKEIVTSGQADCKEYSVCLARILNDLGYQAKIAAIRRGEVYLDWKILPEISEFNHAIVKVMGPSGRLYWVDPTNDVSMVDGIFSDIADRPVEVLDLEKTTYERTPPIDHKHSVSNYERTITLLENGAIKIEGTWDSTGEAAKDTIASLCMKPFSLVKEETLKSLAVKDDPINGTLTFSDEKNTSQQEKMSLAGNGPPEENTASRTVRPLHATFSFEEKHILMHTNHGNAFPLPGHWFEPYITVPQDNEGAIYVGDPETILKKTFFKNVSAECLEKLACSIETPWLNAKRELTASKEGVLVTEKIEMLKSIISSKDLKSKEYKELKAKLSKYYDNVAILFSEE